MTGLPTDAEGLLRLLRARGIRLAARGRSLDVDAPAGALTDELIDAMRRLKPGLLALLADEARGVVRSAPASVNQVRQFHLTNASDAPQTFTVALRFALRGKLDHSTLQQALTALVARHPALRTRYAVKYDELVQQVLAPAPVDLPVVDVPAHRLDHMVHAWAALPFALDEEPSFRALLARVYGGPSADGDRHELVVAMHHGVVDGWSTEILVRDLGALYRAALPGEPAGLP
ncbi:MAG TPA: condensation domain-containing protein, partial [Micromonospora sp.]